MKVMTEAEWLASTDIWSMARFLNGRASDRKLRLFACACCRMVWGWMTDARSNQAVEIAEQFAEGNETLKNLSKVGESSYAVVYEADRANAALSRMYAAWVANMATEKPILAESVIQHTALVAGWNAVPEKDAIGDDSAPDDPAWQTAYDDSMKQEAGELRVAETESREIWLKTASDDTAFACHQLFWEEVDGLHVSTSAISAVFKSQKREANEPFDPLDGRRSGACPSEERAHCMMIREIFGNPFRPVKVAPKWIAWNDGTILKLAQAIHDERAFDRMPILADALEESGCTNAEILNQRRQSEEHVRGCWVVDMLLGKV